MNKKFFSIALAIFLVGGLTSCNRAKKADKMAEVLTFETAKFDTTVNLVKNLENSPKSVININLIYAIGPNASQINEEILKSGILPEEDLKRGEKKTVPRAIEIFTKNYVKNYKQDFGDIFKEDPESQSCNQEFKVTSEISYGKDSIINYRAIQYSECGGAHGNTSTFVMNFDRNTGKIITKNDFFKDGSNEKLVEIITNKILNQFNATDLDDLVAKEGIFEMEDPYVPNLFTIGNDGVTFIFTEEEVGSYSVGEIKVNIPFSEIADLIK
ncbi:MAG: RsiV family protein [Bacteroidales bacterium]|nr:RsiV family protein [Bacteroidales bacterium]